MVKNNQNGPKFVRRGRRTKSEGPKGLQLEVWAQRAPKLPVTHKKTFILRMIIHCSMILHSVLDFCYKILNKTINLIHAIR